MNLLAGIPPGHQAALDSLGGRTASSGDLPFIGSKSGARPRALRGSQRLLRYVLAVGLCLLAMAVVFGTIWIVAVTAAKHATAALMQNPGLLAATPRPTVSRVRGVAPLVTPVAAQASPDPDATGLALPTLKPPPPTSPFSSSAEPSSPPKKPTCTRRDGYFDCLELYHAPSSSASRLPSRRIPRIIHQTGSTTSLTYKQHSWRATWVYYNPEWEMRFYDDAGCEAFVAHEFPGAFLQSSRRRLDPVSSCAPVGRRNLGEPETSGRRFRGRADRTRAFQVIRVRDSCSCSFHGGRIVVSK